MLGGVLLVSGIAAMNGEEEKSGGIGFLFPQPVYQPQP